jgi:hypothetical protein
VGAKWDVLDGNLSLTAALFQVEKDHTRSQISPGVYELTGDVRVRGFQLTAAGRVTPALAGLRRLHLSRRRDRQCVGARQHEGQGAGEHAREQRVAVGDLRVHARMAGRHRLRLHVGSLHVEHTTQ